MRGVNYPYTWFQSRNTQADLAAIAATGSNTVRIVLSTGGQWARVNGPQVAQLIQWCKDLQDDRGARSARLHRLERADDGRADLERDGLLASSDIRAAINGQENFVIINIANEPFGNTTTANYLPDTIAAIQALRTAGLTHNIMIDAANWGQDWSNTMRTNAMAAVERGHAAQPDVQRAHVRGVPVARDDPARTCRPSTTWTCRWSSASSARSTTGSSSTPSPSSRRRRLRGNGYIGWSWSGNGGGGTGLDMTNNFDPAQLTTWGNRIVNGTNGIRATSVLATRVRHADQQPHRVADDAVVRLRGLVVAVPVTANVSWTVTDNQTWITASPTGGTNNGSFTVSATANTGTTQPHGNGHGHRRRPHAHDRGDAGSTDG